jgi:hypothetical protein
VPVVPEHRTVTHGPLPPTTLSLYVPTRGDLQDSSAHGIRLGSLPQTNPLPHFPHTTTTCRFGTTCPFSYSCVHKLIVSLRRVYQQAREASLEEHPGISFCLTTSSGDSCVSIIWTTGLLPSTRSQVRTHHIHHRPPRQILNSQPQTSHLLLPLLNTRPSLSLAQALSTLRNQRSAPELRPTHPSRTTV